MMHERMCGCLHILNHDPNFQLLYSLEVASTNTLTRININLVMDLGPWDSAPKGGIHFWTKLNDCCVCRYFIGWFPEQNNGSISKRQKLDKEQTDKQCEDRISHLSSSLISHILSLLPTKDAVVTSVLSTQWKPFWKLITSLDFDDKLLPHPEKSANISVQTSFIKFVYRVFLFHSMSCRRMFCLKCHQNDDVSHINIYVGCC